MKNSVAIIWTTAKKQLVTVPALEGGGCIGAGVSKLFISLHRSFVSSHCFFGIIITEDLSESFKRR